jgi:hypothetical protein
MTGKKYWVWYYKTKFRNTDITPWCGAFVAWCYYEAGVYDKILIAEKYGPLGYVPTYSRFANKHDKWISRSEAQGGDIIVFGLNMHVGLVEGAYDDYIITIEGNAGPTAEKGSAPVGAVYLGLAYGGNVWTVPLNYEGERNFIRKKTAEAMGLFGLSIFGKKE